MKTVEEIKNNGQIMAIIIKSAHQSTGVEFFTPNDFSQQIASMGHPKGKVIQPHVHNAVTREVHYTKEVLIIKQGKLRVDFYNDAQIYIESRVLHQGDTILLATGGHGFEVLEDLQMIEVKQGPYAGEMDKVRFVGISASEAAIKD